MGINELIISLRKRTYDIAIIKHFTGVGVYVTHKRLTPMKVTKQIKNVIVQHTHLNLRYEKQCSVKRGEYRQFKYFLDIGCFFRPPKDLVFCANSMSIYNITINVVLKVKLGQIF